MRGVRNKADVQRWTTTLAIAASVIIFTIVITQESILKLGILQRLELASIDFRFENRGTLRSIEDSSDIVLVEVSEESFRTLPDRWPWPRSYYAHLIRNLNRAGARAIGIDILLSGPDVHALANDEELRATIREAGNVVLAGRVEGVSEVYIRSSTNENFGNIFYSVDSSLGLVNVRNDADGVYRRYSPFFQTTLYSAGSNPEEVRMPTFGFAVLNKYFGLPTGTIAENSDSRFFYAARPIPKYDAGSVLINFYGPNGTFPRVKFADVIDDSTLQTREEVTTGEHINTFSDPDFGYVHDGTFRNKIVLVGSTMPEDHDLFPVAMSQGKQEGDNLMYGVEIHANVIENVIRGDFIQKHSSFLEILFILFFTTLTFYGNGFLKTIKTRYYIVVELYGLFFALIEILAIGALAIILFNKFNYLFPVISPVVAVVSSYVASTAYHYMAERKQRIMIKSMFSTYVNPGVVDELISNPEKLTLGGQRKELTVLFSDIEGFTTLSEGMQPEALVYLLNEYLSIMTEIVLRNNGTLDKYEGDAIMAFWGAPIPQADHALRACVSALEMQDALAKLRKEWQSQHRPLLSMRVGINTGEMVVGNMGGSGKFDYTVIGDSVNLASRLEGANKLYKSHTLVSQRTYDLVKHAIVGRELDLISVKGRSEPLRIYELMHPVHAPVPKHSDGFLTIYTNGITLYRNGKWKEAHEAFTRALAMRPEDRPSQLYLERTGIFMSSPPPENWNGVFQMTTK